MAKKRISVLAIIVIALFVVALIVVISGIKYQGNQSNSVLSPAINGLVINSEGSGSGTTGCYDKDGGIKPFVYSTLTINGESYSDSCSGNTLTEYYCLTSALRGSGSGPGGSGDSFSSGTVKCADSCLYGRCVLKAPTNLVANLVSLSKIDLSWTDNSNSETGFEIIRSKDGGSWSVIQTTGSNVVKYSDTNLNGMTSYQYKVRAKSAQTTSAYSATAFAARDPRVVCYSDSECPNAVVNNYCSYPSSGENLSCSNIAMGKCTNPGTVSSYCSASSQNTYCTSCKWYCDPSNGLCAGPF